MLVQYLSDRISVPTFALLVDRGFIEVVPQLLPRSVSDDDSHRNGVDIQKKRYSKPMASIVENKRAITSDIDGDFVADNRSLAEGENPLTAVTEPASRVSSEEFTLGSIPVLRDIFINAIVTIAGGFEFVDTEVSIAVSGSDTARTSQEEIRPRPLDILNKMITKGHIRGILHEQGAATVPLSVDDTPCIAKEIKISRNVPGDS